MAYFEGTLTGTQTGLTVMAAIKTALDGNLPTGWSFVEEWTESSTTWHVYKCDKTETGLPNDFHVILLDTEAGSTNLYFWFCEDYDTTNHRMIRPHINYGSSTQSVTLPADGLDGAGNDSTLYRPTTSTVARTAGTGLSSNISASIRYDVSATDTWAVFVYADVMVITLKIGGLAVPMFFGKLTSLVKDSATNDPMPTGIAIFDSLTTNSSYFASSSQMAPTRSAMNANISHTPRLEIKEWHTFYNGSVEFSSHFDKYSSVSGAYVEPLMIVNSRVNGGTSNLASVSGYLRGRLPYTVKVNGGGWGDTITVGLETYQKVSNSGYWILRDDL